MNISLRTILKSFTLSAVSFLLVVGVLFAASTIGAAITTTSTLNADGAVTFGDTLGVTGATTLTTASTTGLVTASSLKFAPVTDSTLSGMVFGYCTASITIVASTTGYAACTDATGVAVGDKIFVQATSSMPAQLVVVAASSSA